MRPRLIDASAYATPLRRVDPTDFTGGSLVSPVASLPGVMLGATPVQLPGAPGHFSGFGAGAGPALGSPYGAAPRGAADLAAMLAEIPAIRDLIDSGALDDLRESLPDDVERADVPGFEAVGHGAGIGSAPPERRRSEQGWEESSGLEAGDTWDWWGSDGRRALPAPGPDSILPRVSLLSQGSGTQEQRQPEPKDPPPPLDAPNHPTEDDVDPGGLRNPPWGEGRGWGPGEGTGDIGPDGSGPGYGALIARLLGRINSPMTAWAAPPAGGGARVRPGREPDAGRLPSSAGFAIPVSLNDAPRYHRPSTLRSGVRRTGPGPRPIDPNRAVAALSALIAALR